MKLIDLIKNIDNAKSKSAKTRARNKFVEACAKHSLSPAWLLGKVTAAENASTALPAEANLSAE